MSDTVIRRGINPRLGVYFGIFASAFAALTLLVLLFELLGVEHNRLRWLMAAGTLGLAGAIAIGARTHEIGEFLTAGRRVPSAYTGLVLAVTAMGGTGLVSLTGAFFFMGFDAWCLGGGIVAGFVVMAVLIAPFLRKYGGATPASFLGRRFDDPNVRLMAGLGMSVSLLMFLVAEMKIAVLASERLTGLSALILGPFLLVFAIAIVAAGGQRSTTWSGAAWAIVTFLALLIPASLVAAMAGNIPVPQMSHGPMLRNLVRIENGLGWLEASASGFAFDVTDMTWQSLAKRFDTPFGSIGPAGYISGLLVIAAGVASAPWLLPRVNGTPGVYEARKAAAWATFGVGLLLLTMAAVAVFFRDAVLIGWAGRSTQNLPATLRDVLSYGFGELRTPSQARLRYDDILIQRDGVLFALPVAQGFPKVLYFLALAGGLAAALAGITTTLLALATTLAEDIATKRGTGLLPSEQRVARIRFALAPVAALAMVLSVLPGDPLKLFLIALAVSGSCLFPVLVLSVWWKPITPRGAIVTIATGAGVAGAIIALDLIRLSPIPGPLAGTLAIPAAILAGIFVSRLQGETTPAHLEVLYGIRIPGGETLSDREVRIQKLKQRPPAL